MGITFLLAHLTLSDNTQIPVAKPITPESEDGMHSEGPYDFEAQSYGSSSSATKPQGSRLDDVIYGRRPVEEALAYSATSLMKVMMRQGMQGEFVQKIRHLAKVHSIPVQYVPEERLRSLVGSVNHQGVVASVTPVATLELSDWIEIWKNGAKGGAGVSDSGVSPAAVLVLDEIEDPHNTGAILRSAAGSGVDAVVLGRTRQAPVNATVVKTSAGTAGRIPILMSESATQAVKELKEAGFWITGLDMMGGMDIWDLEMNEGPMAFVIGNEGRGMRKKTAEACDFLVSIPMKNNVESLNASVSAAVLAYEWARQNRKG